jgi:hypothetical protein
VIGIIGNRRAVEMMDGIAVPVVLVGELWTQTIDVTAATLKRQIPEHVIERAVLGHQNDDVVDLLEVVHADLLSHPRPCGRVWRSSSMAAPVQCQMMCSRTPGDFDVTVHVTQDLAVKPEPTAPATMSGG